MRRVAPVLAALVLVLLLAACDPPGRGKKEVSPAPETVVGPLPKQETTKVVAGDPAKGKSLFAEKGCGGCHTYAPAGSGGNVGPKLENIADDAKKANQGPVEQYVATSIENPGAYVVPGFPSGVMPAYDLPDDQLGDLVAFLTKP